MAKTTQRGKTAEKCITEIDNLRKLLEYSCINTQTNSAPRRL